MTEYKATMIDFDLQYFAQDSPTGQKTEKPTGRKIQKAREKGQVAKSIDLNAAIVLIAGLGALYVFGGFMKNELQLYMLHIIRTCGTPLTDGRLQELFGMTLFTIGKVISPVIVAVTAAAIAVNLYQTQGIIFTMEQFKFKPSKFNPVSNIKKKVFSMKTMVEVLKSLAKIFIIGYFPFRVVKNSLNKFLLLPRMEMEFILAFIVTTIVKILVQVCIILFILALIDYIYQKYEHQKQLMMSKYDIKQERKQMEGDPLVKQEQRRRGRRAILSAMFKAVPEADVVLTNPVHLAVALKYDTAHPLYSSPFVTAKGAGAIAEKIKKIARESGVPVMENKPVARALYKACDVGDEIPADLFEVIANILAFVFREKGRKAA